MDIRGLNQQTLKINACLQNFCFVWVLQCPVKETNRRHRVHLVKVVLEHQFPV